MGGDRTSWERSINGVTLVKQYGYDHYNRPVTVDYPVTTPSGPGALPAGSAFRKRNHYDANGFLTKITTNYYGGGPGDKVLYEALAQNGMGQVTQYKRVDGLITAIDYYKGMPVQYTTPGVQDIGLNYNYANGNLILREDLRSGGLKETFTYDAADRLTKAESERAGVSGTIYYPSLEMSYTGYGMLSGYGRMLSKSDVGEYKYHNFPYNAVKSINDPGGLISHQTQWVEYNSFHKTKLITEEIGSLKYEERFVYDGEENRAFSQQMHLTTPATTRPIARKRWYMDGYEMQETPSGTEYIHYIEGDAGLCGMVVSDGSSFSYYAVSTDHLGSVTAVHDEYSALVAEQTYDAWGKETSASTLPSWLYRGYTGHEMLPEYSLINMNGRMYDPLNGRMLRPDNYVQDPMNAQNYNRYSYCLNNPLKYTDPDGDQYYYPSSSSFTLTNSIGYSGVYYGIPYYVSAANTFSYNSNTNYVTKNEGYFINTYMNTSTIMTNSNTIAGGFGSYGGSFTTSFSYHNEFQSVVSSRLNPEAMSVNTTQSKEWAKSALTFIAADVAIPEPSDAAWPKWLGYGVIGGAAAYTLNPEQFSMPNIFANIATESISWVAKMSFPKPWTYTYRHPSQDPINNPPNGFDPETPPDWKGIVGWTIRAGFAYKIYDEYKSHFNNMPPLLPSSVDNTRVNPQFIYNRK